jgi:hypothetical protein
MILDLIKRILPQEKKKDIQYSSNEGFDRVARLKKEQYGHLSLDLGCGLYPRFEFVGIDNHTATSIQKGQGSPDIIFDLSKGIPFQDNSCECISTSHFLEHSNLDLMIHESWRVLKPGGIFDNTIPWLASAEGMYPGHSIFLSDKWFRESNYFSDRFEIIEVRYVPSDEYQGLPPQTKDLFPFDFARTFLFQAVKEFRIISRSIK